jgi:trk system potassium uptake protein TrkH
VASKSAKKTRAVVVEPPAVGKADPPARAARPPSLAGWFFPAYLALIFLGYAALQAPWAMQGGQKMGGVRALFTAVNATTLTGFRQTIDIDTYRTPGIIMVAVLMAGGSLISMIVGGAAMSRILRLGRSDWQIVLASAAAEAAAIVLGTFFMLFDKERSFGQAVFMAISAFGNCGLVNGPAPSVTAWQTHLFLLPMIAAGGLGVCVLMELWELLRGRISRLSDHAIAVLGMTAWMFIGGTALVLALNGNADLSWPQSVAVSAAAAVGSRTAGMGLADVQQIARPAVWAVMILMAIGAASGGTAGGIKINTIAELARGVGRALAGRPVTRAFGIACAWLGIYSLLVFLSLTMLLKLMPETPGDHVLMLAVSAASNVGLAFERLSPDPGQAFVLCATMITGRMAPMIVLWWMADTTTGADLAVG